MSNNCHGKISTAKNLASSPSDLAFLTRKGYSGRAVGLLLIFSLVWFGFDTPAEMPLALGLAVAFHVDSCLRWSRVSPPCIASINWSLARRSNVVAVGLATLSMSSASSARPSSHLRTRLFSFKWCSLAWWELPKRASSSVTREE